MKYFWVLALVCTFQISGIAQEVKSVPVQFGQFFNAYSIINPASCGSKSIVESELGMQRHRGIWKNISTAYASGSFRIAQQRRRNNFHVAGFSFMRDKEGEYLRRSRFYVTYGWHTRLTKKLSAAAGASLGLYSYIVSGTNANVAGTANSPDASLGVWLYSDSYYLGLSTNQILNSSLTPLEETTKLVQHYNFTGGYSLKASEALSITPKFLIRYVPRQPVNVDVAVIGVINELIAGGINYRYNNGLVPLIGLEKLKVKKGVLKATFSYTVAIGKIANDIQTYELTLNYGFKPNKKKK